MSDNNIHLVSTITPNSGYVQDPVIRKKFQLGDRVVICQKRNVAFLFSTFQELRDAWANRCPYCQEIITLDRYSSEESGRRKPKVQIEGHSEARSSNAPVIASLGLGLLIVLVLICSVASGIVWYNLFGQTGQPTAQMPTPGETIEKQPSVIIQVTQNIAPTYPSKTAETTTLVPSPRSVATSQSQGIIRGHIIFTCFDGNDDEICIMNADGSQMTQLTNNSVGDFYASLSNDTRYIVFSHQIKGSNYEIFRMNSDGTNLVQLTSNGAQNYAPAFSRNDARIVYTSNQGSTNFHIWVMDSNGNNLQKLTTDSSNVDPSWSPNDQQIAFASLKSGSQQIWIMNSDGTNIIQVTNMPDVGGRSCWLADEQRIIFYSGKKSDRNRNIYSIRTDGTDLTQLTVGGDNLGPSCSPYGEGIAFTSYRDDDNEIYIIQNDGSNPTNLTNKSTSDYQPRWGP